VVDKGVYMLSIKRLFFPILAFGLLFAGCTAAETPSASSPPSPEASPTRSDPLMPTPTEPTSQAALPNPASAFCEQQGGQIEIRTDSNGGQYGVCQFQDGTECDEWAFFRGECIPGEPEGVPSPEPLPRYVNEEYAFSFDPPTSWAIEGYPDYVLFTRPGYKMFIAYQMADEDPKPFRTGMPQGDFIDGGDASLLRQAVPKQILVFEGKNKVVAYNGRIKVGDLILVMYLDAVETDSNSYQELDIPQEIIAEADQIISTFALTSGGKPEIEFNP
jgi:putative hemolysin